MNFLQSKNICVSSICVWSRSSPAPKNLPAGSSPHPRLTQTPDFQPHRGLLKKQKQKTTHWFPGGSLVKNLPAAAAARGIKGPQRMVKDTGHGVWTFWKIEIMAGPETDVQFHFTGIKKYFNSYTLTGRMNCVLATYRSIALIVLSFKLRSKETATVRATSTDSELYIIC